MTFRSTLCDILSEALNLRSTCVRLFLIDLDFGPVSLVIRGEGDGSENIDGQDIED